jgi:selenium donor protein
VLSELNTFIKDKTTIGFETSDDAAVYKLSDGNLLVQSVDFFTPIVDDPFTFGQIAASNAVSDIYAMGGKPIFALNVVGFPSDDLPNSVLTDILKGGASIANKAGFPILGGHTIKDKEPKYGMVVTGIVKPENLTKNDTAQPGDVLVLTKPLGSGILTTGIKNNLVDDETINTVSNVMKALNKSASDAMTEVGVNACTDVTGFGLLGHLLEMCKASRVTANLNLNNIPFLDGVSELAQKNVIPGGSKNNLKFVSKDVSFSKNISSFQQLMLADAQTSGGLLISVSKNKVNDLIHELKNRDTLESAIIGEIKPFKDSFIIVR